MLPLPNLFVFPQHLLPTLSGKAFIKYNKALVLLGYGIIRNRMPRCGCLTFGTLESGFVSAPGQPTIKDLLDLYNFRQIGPDTKVFGITGKPVGHSKSPFLYNEAFNCTIPHREAAVKCCDEVDPVAKSIGAVNCITRRQKDGKLFGYNTDYVGAISAIEDGLRASQNVSNAVGSPLAGKLFVVIGAGGAGKALAYGAKEKGARVVIANRTYGEIPRAKELAETIGADAVSLADLDNFHPEYGMILCKHNINWNATKS
ncbi:hypothetical protein Peur_004927 [Populus x canadensis]